MARLDVWLWSVRLFKTRTMATDAVRGGHVRVNGKPAKPAVQVKPGDLVTVRQPGWERKFEVRQAIAHALSREQIAEEAYLDHSPERPAHLSAPVARRDRGAGRPTKRDRREIDRLRGRSSH